VPADFDTDDFMRGAKAFCSRIRSSWNNRDLNDLRAFCTEACMENSVAGPRWRPGPRATKSSTWKPGWPGWPTTPTAAATPRSTT
jgi:hypothetical protein